MMVHFKINIIIATIFLAINFNTYQCFSTGNQSQSSSPKYRLKARIRFNQKLKLVRNGNSIAFVPMQKTSEINTNQFFRKNDQEIPYLNFENDTESIDDLNDLYKRKNFIKSIKLRLKYKKVSQIYNENPLYNEEFLLSTKGQDFFNQLSPKKLRISRKIKCRFSRSESDSMNKLNGAFRDGY